ncbi:hypothetical protein ACFX2C_047087 [Malus domestica]
MESFSNSMKISPLDLMAAIIKGKMDPADFSGAQVTLIILENRNFVMILTTSIAVLIGCVVVLVLRQSSAQKHPGVIQPPRPLIVEEPEPEEAGNGSKKVTIFFSTQTGTVEGFAKALAEEAKARYENVTFKVVDLDDYAADDEAYEEKLKNESLAFFFLATYGDGELTDNVVRFYKWFTEGEERGEWLKNLNYGMFGLGNRQYEHFNKVVVVVDEILAAQALQLLASKFQSSNMSRFEESSKHSWVALSSTGDSPEKPEDEAIEIDPENQENVEGDPKNDGNESEGEDDAQSNDGDYAAEPRVNGTSTMKHHIEKYCRFYQGNKCKKQKVLVGDKSKDNNVVAIGFSQVNVLEACVKMVVIDEMPFSTVDKMGFRLFCAVGIPLFNVPSRRTLVRTFLNMYEEWKTSLKKNLSGHRICLTTDTWTSTQNINYMVLTAHFIDDEWNMHKRIINFCVIPNHYGTTIAKLIENCLLEWGIDRVMTITMDNASANKVALDQLMEKMNRWENSQAILGGKYLHVRCIAHITNIIVSHGMKRLKNGLLAIRNCVRFVRSSPQRLEFFRQAVNLVKLTCKATVCLDCPTRWNSTFVMLDVALKFKKAFATMAEDVESPFVAYFKEVEDEKDEDGVIIACQIKGRKRVGPPTEEDWLKVEAFVKFLRVFYDVTLRVSASTHPTVHTGLHDIIKIETAINNLESQANMQVGLPSEQLLKAMASDMRSKYEKYFDSYHKLNPLIVIGLVLDPRFKLRHVTQLFKKKLSDFEAQLKANEVKDLLHALYDAYAPNVEGGKHMKKGPSQAQYSSTSSDVVSMEDDLVDEWMHFVEDSDEKVVRDEVDSYLLDPLVQITKEESTKHFNILLWWKMNGTKYPILAAIAKDIFAIQVSTVASESAFSTGGRVISYFRSSLTPKSVEALICMQNWLRGDSIITLEDDAPSVEHIEFYESIESEVAKSTSTLASLTLNPQSQQAPTPSQSKSSSAQGSMASHPLFSNLQRARSSQVSASQARSQVQIPPKPSASKCAKGKGKAKV